MPNVSNASASWRSQPHQRHGLVQPWHQPARHGAWNEAAEALRKCVDLNPGMSRGWELLGQSDRSWRCRCRRRSAGKGPRRSLVSWRLDAGPRHGRSLVVDRTRAPQEQPGCKRGRGSPPSSGTFVCKRTGKTGHQNRSPPIQRPRGRRLGEHVAQRRTWEDWIKQGTKVINELRLDFSRDEDQGHRPLHVRVPWLG